MTTGQNVADAIKATTSRFKRWCKLYHARKAEHGCSDDKSGQIGACTSCSDEADAACAVIEDYMMVEAMANPPKELEQP